MKRAAAVSYLTSSFTMVAWNNCSFFMTLLQLTLNKNKHNPRLSVLQNTPVSSDQHICSTSALTVKKKILTWGKGQQAHCPEFFLQQVVPPGHMVSLSHFSSWTSEDTVGTFSIQGRGEKPNGSSQVSATRLHTVPWGQQWTWSSQHTAWQEHKI